MGHVRLQSTRTDRSLTPPDGIRPRPGTVNPGPESPSPLPPPPTTLSPVGASSLTKLRVGHACRRGSNVLRASSTTRVTWQGGGQEQVRVSEPESGNGVAGEWCWPSEHAIAVQSDASGAGVWPEPLAELRSRGIHPEIKKPRNRIP
eukprot:674720-Rhodomonas_salina.1